MSAGFQTNPHDPQWLKSAKSFLWGRFQGLIDAGVYPAFVAYPTHQKADTQYEALKEAPDLQEKVDHLMQVLDQRNAYVQVRDRIVNLAINQRVLPTIGDVDFHDISAEDLERDDVKDILMAAIVADLYEHHIGNWIVNGDPGLDRYAYSTMLSFALIPKSIVKQYATYQMLCMGQRKPILTFILTAAFHSITSYYENNLYYDIRKETINQ